MAKIGDRVRFLNAIGGGLITKIDGKTVYVEDDDGFETPILIKDVVVVMPAGHENTIKGSNIMFDQKAYDTGKQIPLSQHVAEIKDVSLPPSEDNNLIEETTYGDVPNILLAFEPDNIKKLATTRFAGVLVNDSNYFIDFTFLKRSAEDRGWELVFQGTVNPNELIDIVLLTHEELPDYGRIALQGVAYKKDKVFSLLPPLNVCRKLDLTKFHKLHCFHDSKYFDGQVLEFPLVTPGLSSAAEDKEEGEEMLKELKKKYQADGDNIGSNKKDGRHNTSLSPYKKLPLIEVDLHIGELTDTLTGMESKDMLEMQLREVRKTMNAHIKRIGQKIVFIHGKGEGVLRKAVLDLLKKEYPKVELQDASFREYGFGATLVTVH